MLMSFIRASLIFFCLIGALTGSSVAQTFHNAQNFGGVLHGSGGVPVRTFGAPAIKDLVVKSDQPRGLRYFRNSLEGFEDLTDQAFPLQIGVNATEVVAGDLNGDGFDDLVILSPLPGLPNTTNVLSFSIFDSLRGHYLPEVILPTTDPVAPSISDVNSDGSADIVITDRPTGGVALCVVFEQSSPLIFAGSTIAFSSSGATQFKVGNFLGDVRPEIFWLEYQGFGMNVNLLSYQNGVYAQIASGYVPAPSLFIVNSKVGDFNGDGLDDIVLPGFGLGFLQYIVYGISVDASGTILSQLLIGSTFATRNIAIADVQGDGLPDIVTTDYDRDLKIFVQQPNRQFIDQTSTLLPTALPVAEGGVIAADFNLDGRMDFVVVGVIGGGRFMVGVASGLADVTYTRGVESRPSAAATQIAITNYCLGDLIGDLHPDMVELDINGKIVVLEGNGTGDFKSPRILAQSNVFILSGCAILDIDRDGDQDLFFTDQGQDKVLLNTGGSFTVANAIIPIRNTDTRFVRAVDINHDGFLDLVLSGPSPNLANNRILLNGPQGVSETVLPVSPRQQFSKFESKDLNGDGALDLIGVNDAQGSLVMFLQITPTRFFAQTVALPSGTTARNILAEDFDGDADIDLFVLSELGGQLLRNLGPAQFVSAGFTNIPAGTEGIAADFNRDGLVDVAMAVPSANIYGIGDVVVLTNTGAPGFTASSSGLAALSVSQFEVSDVDRDGDQDIISMIGTGSGSVYSSPQVMLNLYHQLRVTPRAAVGSSVTLRFDSAVPGTVVFVVASLDPLATGVASPYGLIRVTNAANAGSAVVATGSGTRLSLGIPNLPSLIGRKLVYQAAFWDASGISLSTAQTVDLTP